jgi:hypothetical protein
MPDPAMSVPPAAATWMSAVSATSKFGRVLTAITCVAVLVSALVYAGASLVLSSSVPWVQFAFEPIVIGACVVGLLFSLGKFRWAPAMTLVCVAGSIAVASVLVWKGMLGQVQIEGQDRGWPLMPWLVGRLAAAAVLTALAAVEVIGRDGRSRRHLTLGVYAAIPLAVSLGAVYFLVNAGSSTTPSLAPWMSTSLLALFGIAAGVSLCAAGHFFIRAFEIGADAAEAKHEGATPPTGAKSS